LSSHYDVIVVGAGPAGNAAAYGLASAGAKVALLEKQTLPRHKTCGGGMPMMMKSTLALEEARGLAPEAFVEQDTTSMRHTFNFADPYLASMNPNEGDNPLSLWMVQRSIFDNALTKRAAQAGAEVRDGLALRSLIVQAKQGVQIQAEGKSGIWQGTADYVIGADGANGMVAKAVGLRKQRTLAIAIEAEVPHRWGEGHPDLRPDVVHLEYGAVRQGYAWVFPKGDHINVGAGVFRPRGVDGRGDNSIRPLLHKAILDYMTLLEVPKREEELIFHAHPLPIWNGMDTIQTRDNRVLLAGDAAGLINPIFGDGILHAIKSGQIAAECLINKDAKSYSKEIRREFRANFDAALKFAQFFYQFPAFCYRHGVKRPTATRTATRLLCGELRFDDIAGKVKRRLTQAMLADKKAKVEDSPNDLSGFQA
jgi:geranylgeranyl reductase family protein